jgi:hypothetical protein
MGANRTMSWPVCTGLRGSAMQEGPDAGRVRAPSAWTTKFNICWTTTLITPLLISGGAAVSPNTIQSRSLSWSHLVCL